MCDIGQRLREIRESAGQNQSDFGERFGVSRNTQYNYEINKRPPDALYLQALHHAGFDITYILTGEAQSGSLSSDETSLVHMFRRVDPERQAVVLATLRLMVPGSYQIGKDQGASGTLHDRSPDFRADNGQPD